jgi:hypothetical protein
MGLPGVRCGLLSAFNGFTGWCEPKGLVQTPA